MVASNNGSSKQNMISKQNRTYIPTNIGSVSNIGSATTTWAKLPSTAGVPGKVTTPTGNVVDANTTKLTSTQAIYKPTPQWALEHIRNNPNMVYYNGRVIPKVAVDRYNANNPKPLGKRIPKAKW
jgi:hypothetical protein